MSKIIDSTYNLLDTLDNSNLIKELTISKEKLLKDKNILSLINKYNNEINNDKKILLKKEIYKDINYQKYINAYNELSLIVLKINNKYHSYTNTKDIN
ncbi:MAG: hypothetical protein IJZ79_07420 [Bacilli bacterium]|nr:hypothetical protein [Bacilli bacterium]